VDFMLRLKEISYAKAHGRNYLSQGQRASMYRWGKGFEIFLDMCKNIFAGQVVRYPLVNYTFLLEPTKSSS
jgi:hypothetical protein